MISRPHTIVLFLLFIFIFGVAGYGEELYTIERDSNKIKMIFKELWSFSEIKIPIYSPDFWGDKLSHNIAVLEIGSEKHILSCKENSDYLVFSESALDTDLIILISINSTKTSRSEHVPCFKATQVQTKYIEDNLSLIIKNENDNIKKNNCFSCHSLLPTALTINTAQSKGFRIDKSLINNLFISITNLQQQDGSFYFKNQPCYGKASTTLSAAYILALLSNNMPTTFIKTGERINKFLKTLFCDNNAIEADFAFEPLFQKEITPLLHEIIFQKNMYLKENTQNQYCNERANNLLKKTKKHNNDTFMRKIFLLTGMPYSFQLPQDERAKVIEEIDNYLQKLPKTKTSETIRMLCLYTYCKITSCPNLPPTFYNSEYDKNNTKNIWKCFEKILYNTPRYLNGHYDESKN